MADDGGSSRPAARASSVCSRPATCGWRWPPCAATTTGARPGPGCSSTASPATGELHGHAVGNLLIVALWEQLGDPVAGLDWVGRLLGAPGRVLPMALTPLEIAAQVRGADPGARRGDDGPRPGRGRHHATARSCRSPLEPADPRACPEAVAAVRDADWVVLGPGSWFTSVIPHLLVPELAGALVETGGPASWSSSTWRRRPARPRASTRATTSRCCVEHAPDLRVRHRAGRPRSVPDRRGPRRRGVTACGARAGRRRRRRDDGSPARPGAGTTPCHELARRPAVPREGH